MALSSYGGGGAGDQGPVQSGSDGLSLLLKLLAGGGGAIAGNAIANNAASNAVPPQVSQLLQMGVDRAAYQNPLQQAATQGAYMMLPDFAKTGIGAPGSQSAPAASGSGGSSVLPAALGLGGAGIAAALLQPNSPLLAALKKLFGSGQPTPTSPYGGGGVGDQGPSFPGLGGGPASDMSNPLSYYKGNPNISAFDPVLGPPLSGTGSEQVLGPDVPPKAKAY